MRICFESRYKRFTNIVTVPLSQYFGCKNMEIVVEKREDELYITFKHTSKRTPIHFNLPIEINKLIYSYCGDFIEIQTKLVCPKLYPYNPPIWNLIKVNNNLYNSGVISLTEYYNTIVQHVNESNGNLKNWSCVYGFEKEILRFFTRINHFETLIENI
uniref:Uncharacterized protein n=1 Tax=viral metagenome TaxID=1070528 RepID=A0A6C0HRM2_9ZZZZ